jgi:hypothetical protein
MLQQWKECIIVPVYKKVVETDCSNYWGILLLSAIYRILSSILLSRLLLLGIIIVGFDITDQLLIRLSAFIRYWKKKWEYNETVYQLLADFKKDYD